MRICYKHVVERNVLGGAKPALPPFWGSKPYLVSEISRPIILLRETIKSLSFGGHYPFPDPDSLEIDVLNVMSSR